jgi:hypothetical protein
MMNEKAGAKASALFDPWTATLQEALEHFAGEEGISAEHMSYVFAFNIARRQESILAGSGRELLDVIATCAERGLAMPQWLADAFLRRYKAVRFHRAASWAIPQPSAQRTRSSPHTSDSRPTGRHAT